MKRNRSQHVIVPHLKENCPFTCSDCGLKFVSENRLKEHSMSVHKMSQIRKIFIKPILAVGNRRIVIKNYQFICIDCGSKFANTHMKENHPLTCSDCGSKFAMENALIDHSIKTADFSAHLSESHYVCNHCVLQCTSVSALIQHIKEKHSFICSDCDSSFACENALTDHSISVHKMVKCSYCNILIKPADHATHMSKNHQVCNHCGSQLISGNALIQHIRENHPFTCSDCSSKFASGNALIDHSISVHKLVKCSYCNLLIKLANLSSHIIGNHHLITCTDCGLKFAGRGALKEHMKENHPFICSDCGSKFAWKCALIDHSISVHKIANNCSHSKPADLENHQFICRVIDCGSNFATASALIKHTKEKHSFICSVCSARFAWKKSLMEHRLSAHIMVSCYCCNISINTADLSAHLSESHHVCNHCGLQLASKMALIQHIKEKHSFVCSDCGAKFVFKNELISHSVSVHKSVKRSYSYLLIKNADLSTHIIGNPYHSKSTATVVKEEAEPCNVAVESDNKRESRVDIKLEDDDFDIQRHRMVLGKICRLCGSKTDDEYKASDYFSEILILTETDIFKDILDVHPQNLCEICKDKLKETELFCAAEFKPHSDYCSICQ